MPTEYYDEDELGDVTLVVYDASGTPASGVQVYRTDTEWEFEGMEETDANGRIVLHGLHASENHGYQFYTFLDGYYVQSGVEGIEPGGNTIVELRPNTVNRQNITIEMIGECTFPCSDRLDFFVNIENCGQHDASYVEILAYDRNGELISGLCDERGGYGFNYSDYGDWFPWLGHGYDLGGLSDSQKDWLEERTGELCIGDLKDVGEICQYPAYDNPMERRARDGYKPLCPNGGQHSSIQNKIRYLRSINLPNNTERVTIRAVGIDSDGNYRMVDKTLERGMLVKKQEWPCGVCIIASGIIITIAGLSILSGSVSILALSKANS
ncbi:MAG: hypothetical protein V1861_01830 [Candidatus Micrarchaeota archaeon]